MMRCTGSGRIAGPHRPIGFQDDASRIVGAEALEDHQQLSHLAGRSWIAGSQNRRCPQPGAQIIAQRLPNQRIERAQRSRSETMTCASDP